MEHCAPDGQIFAAEFGIVCTIGVRLGMTATRRAAIIAGRIGATRDLIAVGE